MTKFDDLTLAQRGRIIDRVRNDEATFNRRHFHDPAELEDIVRWTVDAFFDVAGDEMLLTRFEEGVNEALDGKWTATG